jgi:hypothetical protein
MSKERQTNIDKNRFKTPEGYFESISSNSVLFSNKNNFKTPLNYFETLEFSFNDKKTKTKTYLLRNMIYSGIAAIFILVVTTNLFPRDSTKFSDNEIISYLDYNIVDFRISEYSELFDKTTIEVNFESFTENEYDYFIETNFNKDDYIIFE